MKLRFPHSILLPLLFSSALNSQLSTALAQGTTFTHQGQLFDNGSPANGVYDLRFAIYDLANGGNALAGPLTNSAVAVSNGQYTVTLDFGAGVFDGADRWLQMDVRAEGAAAFTPLTPRQPITPTPYAITAGGVTGNVSASQLTGTILPANIGAGTINSLMLADGSVTSIQLADGSVTSAQLADGAVTADKLETVVLPVSVFTFTNPAPESFDAFGSDVAAVGSNGVLIGARNDTSSGVEEAGAAYLFSLDGGLMATFTNPMPASGDLFGSAVAAVGIDRVLIGAQAGDAAVADAGAAYLFDLAGNLITTFTNPTPESTDAFGARVAAVGTDRVLISAIFDDAGAADAGAAYLFDTNGVLLTTFTNPAPSAGDAFGTSLAALGTDRVLVGAYLGDGAITDDGLAYLFQTDGVLLTTFTNPVPAFEAAFGFSVTAVGADRVLVGAPADSSLTTNAGVAWLFDTNGTAVAVFKNPTPAVGELFGYAVAALGPDRVVIGAIQDDLGAQDSGAAYVFDLRGTLLATLPNPTPAVFDAFGASVATIGTDRVLVGASSDNTREESAGAAYLFTLDGVAPGVFSAGVGPNSITAVNLTDGSVGASKLDAGIGLWTAVGTNIHRLRGWVGVGTANPIANLDVRGGGRFTSMQIGPGSDDPAATLDVRGSVRLGLNSSVFNRIQAGSFTVGPGNPGVNTLTVNFPSPFAGPPMVHLTSRGSDVDDTFVVTARDVRRSDFKINIYRVDMPGSNWVQSLVVDWLAWQ